MWTRDAVSRGHRFARRYKILVSGEGPRELGPHPERLHRDGNVGGLAPPHAGAARPPLWLLLFAVAVDLRLPGTTRRGGRGTRARQNPGPRVGHRAVTRGEPVSGPADAVAL